MSSLSQGTVAGSRVQKVMFPRFVHRAAISPDAPEAGALGKCEEHVRSTYGLL